MEETKAYNYLLNNLRILGCVEPGEYIGTLEAEDERKGYDIYCRYSGNWWNTLSDIVRLETWNCTYDCLKSIYCMELPEYVSTIKGDLYKAQDLKRVCTQALVGLKHLKTTYNITYQSNTGGQYDEKFDTIIDSYATLYIKVVNDIIDDCKSYDSSDDDDIDPQIRMNSM